MWVKDYYSTLYGGKVKHPEKRHPQYSKDWFFLTAKELKENWYHQRFQMRQDCKWTGEDRKTFEVPFTQNKGAGKERYHLGTIPMKPWLQFLGWYISEGVARNAAINICQSVVHVQNRKRIAKCIKRIGLKPTLGKDGGVRCYAKELVDYLQRECGDNSFVKKVPDFVKELSSSSIKIFLSSLFAGDGWKNKKKGGYSGYGSYSPQLLDDVQELLIKVGMNATIHKGGKSLGILTTQLRPTTTKSPKEIDYKGNIYCVSVPNQTIMIRRNGKTLWTGNSYKGQKIYERLPEQPTILVHGHVHKLMALPMPPNHYIVIGGSLQRESGWLVQNGVVAQVGWVILKEFNKEGALFLLRTPEVF